MNGNKRTKISGGYDALHDASGIAIVGMAATLPKAPTPDDLWQMILKRDHASSIIPETRWPVAPQSVHSNTLKPDKTRSVHACLLDSLPDIPDALRNQFDLSQLDPVFHLTLHTGHLLYQDICGSYPDSDRTGIILGNIILPTSKASEISADLVLPGINHLVTGIQPKTAAPLYDTRNLYPAALPANMLAQSLGISGIVYTLDAACASSLYALKLASMELISGRLDMVLTGGVSRPDCMYTQMGFSQLQALSPSGICSPFDSRADGLVVGEGAAMVALKRLSDAVRDQDKIYGVIRAIGISNDIGGSVFAPDSEGQIRAMKRAYKQAGWMPSDVELVECHGTGTPVGDAVEFSSLLNIWHNSNRENGTKCAIGSVKSNIGHLLTAAGGAGLIKALLAIRHGMLPPSANYDTPSSKISLDDSPFRILKQPETWIADNEHQTRRAAVSAFGFGGINAHLLLEEWNSELLHSKKIYSSNIPSRVPEEKVDQTSRNRKSRDKAPEKIAIVSMASAAGSWTDMDGIQKISTGIEDASKDLENPNRKHTWNGLDQSDWFCDYVINPGNFTEYPLGKTGVSPVRFRIPPAELQEMLPQQLLMLKVAADAIDQGNWNESDAVESGVFIGVGLDLNTTNFCIRWHLDKIVPEWLQNGQGAENICVETIKNTWSPALTANRTMGALGGMVAGRVSRAFKVGGAGFTVSADELSGIAALSAAVQMLQHGEICQALVGAVDLNSDWRNVIGTEMRTGSNTVMDSSTAFVLKRLKDAEKANDTVLAVIDDIEMMSGLSGNNTGDNNPDLSTSVVFNRKTSCLPGDTGVVSGLNELAQAVIAIHHRIMPADHAFKAAGPQYWLRNREDGLRLANVCSQSFSGASATVCLSEHDASSHKPLALPELTERLSDIARQFDYSANNDKVPETAFVYSGSGNHRPFLGREPGFVFRHILDELDKENCRLKDMFQPEVYWNQPDRKKMDHDPHGLIVGHVMYGYFVTELIRRSGVRPNAVIGYSLGESTALVGWKIWPDRDRVLRQLQNSTLFVNELAGPCNVLVQAWNLPEGTNPEWKISIVNSDAETLRKQLSKYPLVYLLIINTPEQCVIGGHGPQLQAFLKDVGLSGVDVTGVTVAHIPEVSGVADEYRQLHFQPVDKAYDIRVYSGAWGKSYPVNSDQCANAILAHATEGIDFVKTVKTAWQDGVRHFVEIGPGNSCTNMIHQILKGQDYSVDLLDNRDKKPSESLFGLLSRLASAGHNVNLELLVSEKESAWRRPGPNSPLDVSCIPNAESAYNYRLAVKDIDSRKMPGPPQSEAQKDMSSNEALLSSALHRTGTAVRKAHEQYLELSQNWTESMRRLVSFQTELLPHIPCDSDTDKMTAPCQQTVSKQDDVFMDREQCLEFAVGSIANVLGPEFSEADTYPTRVRLPDEPLMLVDRIISVDAIPKSMKPGSIITEHDVLPDAWYLDQGKCPVCITVEAGQADLFLSGFLGIDFETKGVQKYRLLDAEITMAGALPEPGETIRYSIRITRFFRQENIWLFHFEYDASIDGELLLSMRNGTAGFFSDKELAAGQGIIQPAFQKPCENINQNESEHIYVRLTDQSFDERQVNALRRGCLTDCFGESFEGLPLKNPAALPGGKMHLIDRIVLFEPVGGQWKLGKIRAEADIQPDAWFLTCHFVDDMVMPGTLMYECCFHALKVLLMGMGWVGEEDEFCWNPKPGVPCQLKCRGQVTSNTRVAAYEVCIKEIGLDSEPYAVADAMMYADNKPVVEIRNMSVQLTGLTRERLNEIWSAKSRPVSGITRPIPGTRPALYNKSSILAFSNGNPSEAYGDKYSIFDSERIIARLPGPPYQFLDRVVLLEAEPWIMKAGGRIITEYDMRADEWYLAANGRSGMPFAVLLEIALQPCGWYSAYMGSALYSQTDLSYRNLGGNGVIHRMPDIDTASVLAVEVKSTKVSHSGGMIIQHFDFAVYDSQGDIYTGDTYFGFFTRAALAEQVGIRDQKPVNTDKYLLKKPVSYPLHSSLPESPLRMIDTLTVLKIDDGPHGFGLVEGTKSIDPKEWFFSAHFYQDPVWPGSLGIEAMLQLLQVYALERWGDKQYRFEYPNARHQWIYRGQVLPSNRQVTVQAVITKVDDTKKTAYADGFLIVDGKLIYSMKNFVLVAIPV